MDGTGIPQPATTAGISATAARARRLYERGAFERARALLGALPADEPGAVLARADFHLHVGDAAAAIAAYEQAAGLAPGSVHAHRGRAAALIALERPDDALAAAREAAALLEVAPAPAPTEAANVATVLAGAQGLLAAQGGLLAKLRWGPGVRAGFERAVALDPANPYARTGLGRFFLQAPQVLGGDAERALAELGRAFGHAPFYYLTHAWYIAALEANAVAGEASRERHAYVRRYAAYPGALAALEGLP